MVCVSPTATELSTVPRLRAGSWAVLWLRPPSGQLQPFPAFLLPGFLISQWFGKFGFAWGMTAGWKHSLPDTGWKHRAPGRAPGLDRHGVVSSETFLWRYQSLLSVSLAVRRFGFAWSLWPARCQRSQGLYLHLDGSALVPVSRRPAARAGVAELIYLLLLRPPAGS